MKIKIFIIFAVIIAIICTVCGFIIKTSNNKVIETYSAKVMQESTIITSEYSGTISNIFVKGGQHVKLGQELIELTIANDNSSCLSKESLSSEQTQAAEE